MLVGQFEDVTLSSGCCDGHFSQFSLESIVNRSIHNCGNTALKMTVVQLTSSLTKTVGLSQTGINISVHQIVHQNPPVVFSLILG